MKNNNLLILWKANLGSLIIQPHVPHPTSGVSINQRKSLYIHFKSLRSCRVSQRVKWVALTFALTFRNAMSTEEQAIDRGDDAAVAVSAFNYWRASLRSNHKCQPSPQIVLFSGTPADSRVDRCKLVMKRDN